MLNKAKIATIAMLLSVVATTTVQAKEVTVAGLVNIMVSQAVATTRMEIQNSVETAIAQTAYVFSIEDDTPLLAKVTIIDLAPELSNETE